MDAGVSALSIEELREYRDQLEPGDTERVRADALLHRRMAEPLARWCSWHWHCRSRCA